MSSFNDPKAAFDAETDEDHGQQQTRAISMLSGSDAIVDDGPLGGIGASREGRNVLGQTTLMIAIVAVVAAVSLYAMRLTQADAASASKDDSAIVAKLDNWLTKADAGTFSPDDATNPANFKTLVSDTEQVLRVLNINAAEHQVPIEYVQKNPFTFNLATTDEDTGIVYDPSSFERAQAQRRRQLEMDLSKFRVDSIMLGKRSVAMVNGEMFQVGDHLGEFVIEDIQSMQVLLRHGQEKFTLSIDMDSTGARKRR